MEQPIILYFMAAIGVVATSAAIHFYRKFEKTSAELGVELTLKADSQELVQQSEQKIAELYSLSVTQKEEIAANKARVEDKENEIKKRDEDLSKLRKRLEEAGEQVANQKAQNAEIKAKSEEREKAFAAQVKQLSSIQEEMSLKFEKAVNDGLKNQGEAFTKNSMAKLKAELDPFKTNVDKFEKELRAVNQSAKTERELLQSAIGQVNEQTKSLADEAINLTRALKGDTRQQGVWGESVLQRILETSGLRKGEEYEVQVSRKDDEGKTFRPDVVVKLPEGKTLIVDAKVSLLAYQEIVNSEDEQEYESASRRNVQSIKSHITNLSSKDYTLGEDRTLDYVMMFIPIEGAFAEALKREGDLTEFAIKKGITITTPTTLTMALKTIASVWHVERRNKNAEEIALQAGRMYDKLARFIGSMEKVGNHIKLAGDSYGKAYNQLKDGRGSLVSRAVQLKNLGATTTKSLSINEELTEDGE